MTHAWGTIPVPDAVFPGLRRLRNQHLMSDRHHPIDIPGAADIVCEISHEGSAMLADRQMGTTLDNRIPGMCLA
jgi:hypothetical protein